jgi:hypothetical protein
LKFECTCELWQVKAMSKSESFQTHPQDYQSNKIHSAIQRNKGSVPSPPSNLPKSNKALTSFPKQKFEIFDCTVHFISPIYLALIREQNKCQICIFLKINQAYDKLHPIYRSLIYLRVSL